MNLLGDGLHSYGFTSGIWKALLIFYFFEGGIFLLGSVAWWVNRQVTKRTQEAVSADDELQHRTT